MNYQILKKKIGTNSIDKIVNFSLEDPILDILWKDEIGLIYTSGKCLGKLTPNMTEEYPWKGTTEDKPLKNGIYPSFGFLSGLSFNEQETCLFICENGGKNVRRLDLQDEYVYGMLEKESSNKTKMFLKNTPESYPAYVAGLKSGEFYIAYPSIKKCFIFKDSQLQHVAGDGKGRFSNGQDAISTSIGEISDICIHDNSLFLLDSLSGIVKRKQGNKLNMAFGHPLKDILCRPFKMVSKKGVLYVVDEKGVKSINFKGKNLNNSYMYMSSQIKNIALDNSDNIYILETE